MYLLLNSSYNSIINELYIIKEDESMCMWKRTEQAMGEERREKFKQLGIIFKQKVK